MSALNYQEMNRFSFVLKVGSDSYQIVLLFGCMTLRAQETYSYLHPIAEVLLDNHLYGP